MTLMNELDDVRHHFPDIYESKHNVKLLPTALTSEEMYRRRWYKEHKDDFIEIEFWDEKDGGVPPGEVLVQAALGGDENKEVTYWGVVESDFLAERTEFGYIVNPSRDKPKKLA